MFTASCRQKLRWGTTEGVEQEVEAVSGALFACADHGTQDVLPSCASPGAVAAPYFAVHHGRANCLLGTIVGGVDRRIDQEPEPVHGMIQQMPGQTPIRLVREAALRQLFQFTCQAQAVLGQVVAAQSMATPGTPQPIRAVDQPEHRARQSHGAPGSGFQQSLAAALQVRQALLMNGAREAVVHAPAVMHQSARPVEPQQLLGRFAAARRIDHVTGFSSADERVQPGRSAADTPAGLVGHDLRRAANVLPQLLVRRLTTLGRPRDRAGAGAARSVSPANNVASSFTLLPCDKPSCLFMIASAAWTFAPN